MEIRPHRIINRRNTKKIKVGDISVGGDSPISVQSMTNTLTTDHESTIKQIKELEEAESDIEEFYGPSILLDAPSMPTMGLYVHRWDSGLTTRRYRSATNNVFVVMQGAGITTIEGEKFEWERGDTIAAPVWKWIEHCSSEDSVVFRMTDEPIMKFARYYRIEGD